MIANKCLLWLHSVYLMLPGYTNEKSEPLLKARSFFLRKDNLIRRVLI